MMNKYKKAVLVAACTAALGAATAPAHAANWLILQGTEAAGTAPRAKVWGFIQTQYQKDTSDPNAGGGYIPPKLIGPNLTSQSSFNVNRARLGARGTGFPLDSNINYFLLAEFGNNGITAPNNSVATVTDASITLNHIKGARIRAGLFKTPGSEEGLQAIHVFDYINFTTMGNQMLLERFPNDHFTYNYSNTAGSTTPTLPVEGSFSQFDKPVGAYRDVGVQVFDAFNMGNNWEFSYAFMVGNGNGINFTDNDNSKDKYAYFSLEKIYGGKGPRRQGLKMFVWAQRGKRLLDQTDDATYNPVEHDRNRSGLGFKYLKGQFRATAEYATGKGMIFVGPDKPTFDQNGASAAAADGPAANGADGKAKGWYVEGGWYVPHTNWEFDLRYDVYNRLTDDPGPPAGPAAGRSFESEWKTWTAGVQYHFNKKTRVTFNAAFRDVSSPEWPAGAGPNANMDGIGNVYALQLTHIF